MAKDYSKNFYNSYRWRRCAKAYAESKLYICERCHGLLTPNNINNDAVAYGWDNLMFLCIECHNAIHAELDAMTIPNGLTSGASLLVRPTRGMIFNELGDLVAVNDNEHDNN